ncbi:hypothetical protein A3K63_02900 [Candidatus Micrarchaeota archaeon RBG_16_49_10]|nr:MAG: hypothetical protein A3K63_02900 [Candidatus Micrarchaeota archaeon RBG_16_49_10]
MLLLVSASLATVLPWGNRIIQKKKDMKSLDDAYNFFIILDKTIRDVAKNGGEQSLTLDVPGIFEINPDTPSDSGHSYLNNTIQFYFQSRASNIAQGDWIPLNTPNNETTGVLGIDSPSVIFGRAEMQANEIDVKYLLWYRELDDQQGHVYKIVLNTTDNMKKVTTSGFLKIQRLGTDRTTVGGNEVMLTKINIIV